LLSRAKEDQFHKNGSRKVFSKSEEDQVHKNESRKVFSKSERRPGSQKWKQAKGSGEKARK
jgi:hypothetical protein